MDNYSKLMESLPDTFEEFIRKVIIELGLTNLTDEQQQPLFYELQILFSSSLIDAADNMLSTEDRDYMDAYLLAHPESNEMDLYFLLASEKYGFKAVIESTLSEVFDEIKHLKDSLE
jgi:hypothetical protein